MELQERLNNISKAGVLRDDLEMMKRDAERQRREEYQAYFDKHLKRIYDLIMTAKHLQANGFLLGNKPRWDRAPEFVSEGIYHEFGFVCKGNPYMDADKLLVIGVGYVAGGCYGHINTIIDENGFVSMNECFYRTKTKEQVEADLLDFENRFYKYVDNL
jgi:hypothetical protein